MQCISIYMIPMGSSAQEGYQNFMKAFNNQQRDTFIKVASEDITETTKPKGDTTIRKIKEKRK